MNERHNFDDALREWANRPPRTSASQAARAILDRSSVGQGFSLAVSPAWATLAAALVLLVAGTTSFIRSLPPRPATGITRVSVQNDLPAGDADVVLWLDDGTPVYVFLPGGK